jgi:hypothetical protein
MALTQLTAAERGGHWVVRMDWPNGIRRYLGEFPSKREAVR